MIGDFAYEANPMRVRFGSGSLERVADELDHLGLRRVLVLCSPSQQSVADRTTRVTACWDNEEVGSTSAHGAQSNFLEAVLHRLISVGVTDPASIASGAGLHAAIANSFLFSIDMGHACHPSFTEKHEVNLRPRINGGIVIKTKCGLARAERR